KRGVSLDSAVRSGERGSRNALQVIEEGESAVLSDGVGGGVPIARSRSAPDPASPIRRKDGEEGGFVSGSESVVLLGGGGEGGVSTRRQFARLPPSDTPLPAVGLAELAGEIVGKTKGSDSVFGGSEAGSPGVSPRREDGPGGLGSLVGSPGRTLIVHQKHHVVLKHEDTSPKRSNLSDTASIADSETTSPIAPVVHNARTSSLVSDSTLKPSDKPLPPTPDTITVISAPPTPSHSPLPSGPPAPRKLRRRKKKPLPSLPTPPKQPITPAVCPCEKDHASLTPVIDKVFDLPLSTIWSLLYTRDSLFPPDGFLNAFLDGKRKVRDVKMLDWVDKETALGDAEGLSKGGKGEVQFGSVRQGWHRKVEYVVPLTNPLGPKQTRTKLHEHVVHKESERYFCVKQVAETPDVPSGNAFEAHLRLCVLQVSESRTRVRAGCSVEWIKSSWLKMAINSAVPEGLKEFHAALGEAVEEYAKTHPYAPPPPPTSITASADGGGGTMSDEEGEFEDEEGSELDDGGEAPFEDGGVVVPTVLIPSGGTEQQAQQNGSENKLTHPLEAEMALLDGDKKKPLTGSTTLTTTTGGLLESVKKGVLAGSMSSGA
ncbi:hypothetical protein HK097_005852, partial [Rhizophlyctis rosea]